MTNTLSKDAPVRISKTFPDILPESLGPLVKSLVGGKPDMALHLKGITLHIVQQAKELIKWSWSIAFQ
jgi:hypothetical protein